MNYYIYENWQAGPHKTVIHEGSCGFCNEGNGIPRGTKPQYGRWHGPFDALDEANQFAHSLPDVKLHKTHRCVG